MSVKLRNYKFVNICNQKVESPPTPSAVERARSVGPFLLKETACGHEKYSLQASGLKVLGIGTPGPALKATGVPTSSD